MRADEHPVAGLRLDVTATLPDARPKTAMASALAWATWRSFHRLVPHDADGHRPGEVEEAALGGEFEWSRYRRLALAWELWGAFALVTPVAALVLMVLKPGS